jgi:hypothetical protein
MPGTKEDVLQIRCSDGRSRKANHIRDHLVHDIRLPGGVLFPDLCAYSLLGSEQTFEMSSPIQAEIQSKIKELISLITPETGRVIGELVLLLSIRTMVDLKKPKKILLVYHNHCGAAEAINFTEVEVRNKLAFWRGKLGTFFPTIEVSILRETHSACGEHHHGHEDVESLVAEAVLARAA